jgi:hypothetical protein
LNSGSQSLRPALITEPKVMLLENLLLKDPIAGFGSLGDRLGQFDRSTFVAIKQQTQQSRGRNNGVSQSERTTCQMTKNSNSQWGSRLPRTSEFICE